MSDDFVAHACCAQLITSRTSKGHAPCHPSYTEGTINVTIPWPPASVLHLEEGGGGGGNAEQLPSSYGGELQMTVPNIGLPASGI